jgi:dTDP-4-amino-4,6-dideoxygalactose transaminase
MQPPRKQSPGSIPVARPLLPSADALLPRLRQVDASRTYSNFGPQVRALEAALCARLRVPAGSVCTVANATVGLSLALRAQGAPAGGLCVMPAWSFAASAHAAVDAGLVPYFVDVDPAAGVLTVELAAAALARLPPGSVAAVMPVAPFGHPVNTAAWDRFQEQSRVAVVIDAAAGFDALVPARVPAVVSLHATKALGAGEGGFVVARDKALIVDIERRTNFGLMGSREAKVPAVNGKMSEYAAVVGLAGLDAWAGTRAAFASVAQAYARGLRRIPGVEPMPGFGSSWVAATAVVCFRGLRRPTDEVVNGLADLGVSTRRWWCRGLHEEPAFSSFGRGCLPVTSELAESTLGLPCYVDMTRAEVAQVCASLAEVLCGLPAALVA